MLDVENNKPSILHLDTQLATHVNLYNHTNNIEPHKLSNITSSHFVPVKTTCATFRLCYTKIFDGVKMETNERQAFLYGNPHLSQMSRMKYSPTSFIQKRSIILYL